MKTVLIIIVALTTLNLEAIETAAVLEIQKPGYEVAEGTRDPFFKKVEPVFQNNEKDEVGSASTGPAYEFKIHGAMKGSRGQAIGVFNFGALAVGSTKQIVVGGRKIEVILLNLNMTTMDAELVVDNKVINVSKNGGKR